MRPTGKVKEKEMEERVSMKAKRRIWAQRKTARYEGEKGGMGPNGAKHGGRWFTPPGHVGSGRGRDGGR